MAKVLTEESNLQNIAAAIRRKKADTVKYLPSEMAGAIDEIENYPEPFGEKSITQNGLQNVKDYEFADVNVSAQIEPEDEGKVVVNGELVEQTSTTVTENDTYDTTANDEVVVNVPNSYSTGDEGKVVDNGELVAQTSRTVTSNGTYDTTTNDEVIVDVSGGGTSDNDLLFHFADFKNSGKMDAVFYNKTGYEISDEQSKFGGTSLKIKSSPATGGAVYIDSAFTLGNEDFTLDFWVYVTVTTSSNCAVSFNYRSLAGYVNSGTNIGWNFASSSGSWASSRTVNVQTILNAWHHWALVRQGNTFYTFLDGILIDTFNWSGSFAPMTRMSFGTNSTSETAFRGYIDEFRLKIGEAVWTEDFTPPTQQYV